MKKGKNGWQKVGMYDASPKKMNQGIKESDRKFSKALAGRAKIYKMK